MVEESHASSLNAALPGCSTPFGHRLLSVLDRAAKLLGVELTGVENLPPGRAVLVTNHAFGFDAAFTDSIVPIFRVTRARNIRPPCAISR